MIPEDSFLVPMLAETVSSDCFVFGAKPRSSVSNGRSFLASFPFSNGALSV